MKFRINPGDELVLEYRGSREVVSFVEIEAMIASRRLAGLLGRDVVVDSDEAVASSHDPVSDLDGAPEDTHGPEVEEGPF
jgi:hypothetical protein